MSKSVATSFDENGDSLPILDLQFSEGIRLAATREASVETEILAAGVYQIRASSDAYISSGIEPVAGDAAGSTFLAAGVPDHLIIHEGQKISARGVNSAASVFIIPARCF